MERRIENFKAVLLSVIVCPEMLILLSIPFSCLVLSQPILYIISSLDLPQEKLKFLSLLPFGPLGLTVRDLGAILHPSHENKDVLLQWPGYWTLKVAFFGGLIYQFLFAGIGLSAWFLEKSTYGVYTMVALFTSILGSLVCYLSILHSKAKVQEKLAEYIRR